LAPDPDLVAASICADHTGEEHPVADLLQALDEGRRGNRTITDYEASLREVERVREGLAPSAEARHALDGRQRRREAARELAPRFEIRDGLAFAVSDHSIDTAFFPALARDAAVVIIACPNVADRTRWTVKLRLGESAPKGLTLQALGIEKWDDRYGGRWNAGSNGRGGGIDLSPEVYADRVRQALAELLRPPSA
jgi:hypothetical protein